MLILTSLKKQPPFRILMQVGNFRFAPAGHLFERLQQQLLAERGRSYLDQGGTTPLLRA